MRKFLILILALAFAGIASAQMQREPNHIPPENIWWSDSATFTATSGANITWDFSAATAFTLGALTQNGAITLGAGHDFTTTAGDGELNLNFTISNASGALLDIAPAFAGGASDTLTYSLFDVAAFAPTNAAGTDTVSYFTFGAFTDPGATITSEFMTLPSGLDTGINFNAMTALNLGSAGTDFTTTTNLVGTTAGIDVSIGNSTGNITALGDNIDFSGTDATDNVFQLLNATGAVVYLDLDLGATDLLSITPGAGTDVTIGNATGDVAIVSATWDVDAAGALTGLTGLTVASGAVDFPAASVARADLATTTKSIWIGAGMTDAAATEANGSLYNIDATVSAVITGVVGLTFDADGGSTGDDTVHISWIVPTGYVADTAVLEVYWVDPGAQAEDAGDDVVFIGTTQAVAAGEVMGAAGTAWTPVTDEVIDTADVLNIASIDIEVEDIAVGDHVTLVFEVDESASQLNVAGTASIIGWRITWTSNN